MRSLIRPSFPVRRRAKDTMPNDSDLSPEQLQRMAALIDLDLSDRRAAGLALQAGAHFSLLSALSTTPLDGFEPAGEFRLDDGE